VVKPLHSLPSSIILVRCPRGPKGEKRPADLNARAVMIAKISTGEIEDVRPTPESEGKSRAAVELGPIGS
jgi:hypothetical protein